MIHCIKYELICLLRNKIVIFWLLAFPIILGTLFYAAFSGISEKENYIDRIPIAIVKGENTPEGIIEVLEALSEGEESLFEIKEGDKDEMMKSGEIHAIIYTDGEVYAETKDANMESAVIKSVLDSYSEKYSVIEDVLREHPENIAAVTESLMETSSPVKSTQNEANDDPYVQYFYNIIAMCGLFGSMMGIYCAINHQANLSPLGMRVELSPVKKAVDIFSSLVATFLVHFACNLLGALYMMFVLGIDFRVPFGIIALLCAVSCVLGDTLGCFVGAMTKAHDTLKIGIMVCVSLFLCMCSGMMYHSVYALIEEHFPIFNRINPAALVVNGFYSVSVYGTYDKLRQNVIILLIECAAMLVGAVLATRKRKYKSV